MAASGIKPGVPVILRELEPSSRFFNHGQSLRVTGRLEAYQAETGIAEISDGNVRLKIDTWHLTDLIFCAGFLYQFIGELVIGFNTNDLCAIASSCGEDGRGARSKSMSAISPPQ